MVIGRDPNVASGSKPEKLNPSRCFLLDLQKLTYLPYRPAGP